MAEVAQTDAANRSPASSTPSLGIAAFEYQLPLDEKLRRVAALGVDRCELATPGDVTTSSAEACRDLVETAGIHVSAVCSLSKPNSPDGTELGLELLEESIRCAAVLGAPAVIAYFGAHPDRPHREAIERYRELTKPMLELAEELEISILIENHFSHAPGDVTSGPTGCAELIEAIGSDRFGLNFDPCNFAIAGIDEASAYEALRPYVRNVHVKDARQFDPVADADYPGRVVTDTNRGQFIFVPVGDGIANNEVVLRALMADGFAGTITVEGHTPQETLDAVFERGLSLCREHV